MMHFAVGWADTAIASSRCVGQWGAGVDGRFANSTSQFCIVGIMVKLQPKLATIQTGSISKRASGLCEVGLQEGYFLPIENIVVVVVYFWF